MEQKFKEEVPEYEMEKILARRKDPKEREKVVTFYKVLLSNIEDELDEKVAPGENETIVGLLDQLEQDLKDRGEFEPFEDLSPENLRIEMLLLLHDRIQLRINKVPTLKSSSPFHFYFSYCRCSNARKSSTKSNAASSQNRCLKPQLLPKTSSCYLRTCGSEQLTKLQIRNIWRDYLKSTPRF